MHLMSNSSLSTFRQCPRLYYHKYVLGRSTISLDPKMHFGRIWDDVTGVWWKDGPEAAVKWLVSNAANIDPVDAAKIAALLKHYHPPVDRFEFIDNQVEKRIRIRNPDTNYPMHEVELICIADSLLRDRETGAIVVREAKTTGTDITGFGPYWQRLQVDSQVAFYYLAFGAEKLYYDVTGRPGIKCCGKDEKAARDRLAAERGANQWTGKDVPRDPTPAQVVDAYQDRLEALVEADPEKFYQWRAVHKTNDDLREAQFDLYQQARALREGWKADSWPRNSSQCLGRFGTCPFLDVCTGRADIEDDAIFETKEWAKNRQLPAASVVAI